MHLILRILKFDILRIPPIRISTKRLTHSSKIWLCVATKTRKMKNQWLSIDLQYVTSLHAPYLRIIFLYYKGIATKWKILIPTPKKNLPKLFCSRRCSDRVIFWKILLLHKNMFCTSSNSKTYFGLERMSTPLHI
jgi:hypothetical protein